MNLTLSTYEQALAYLTINSSFTGYIGLFHGRMGIILFFVHYAHSTQSKHYEDFAGYLLDELYEEIHEDLPVNLENGLCGISWGIEYLVQQGFMEVDTDEILVDIDCKMMELDPLRMTNLSFRCGLAGIAFYVINRLGITEKEQKATRRADRSGEEKLKLITNLFPCMENAEENIEEFRAMGVGDNDIRLLLTGKRITYSGNLYDREREKSYQVKSVKIDIAQSRTRNTTIWLNNVHFKEIFKQIWQKLQKALGLDNNRGFHL